MYFSIIFPFRYIHFLVLNNVKNVMIMSKKKWNTITCPLCVLVTVPWCIAQEDVYYRQVSKSSPVTPYTLWAQMVPQQLSNDFLYM